MTTKLSIILSIVVFLAGCASAPRPRTRQAWQTQHSQSFTQSPKVVLNAAQKVFNDTDGDFKYQYPRGGLIATRRFLIYAVLSATTGQDYWKLTTRDDHGDTVLTVNITRDSSSILPSAGVSTSGSFVGTAQSVTTPGREVYWPAPYKMFFARLGYVLGQRPSWLTCDQAHKQFDSDFQSGQIGVMCGVTTDNDGPSDQS